MSTRVSRRIPLRSVGPSSQRKKVVLEFDLNETPSGHSHFNEGDAFTRTPIVPEVQGRPQRSQLLPVTIDVDTSDDDDVVLSSPRAFEEARNNLRWHQNRSDVVDVDSEPEVSEAANNRNKRQRVPANVPVINCESYVARDRNKNVVNGYGRNMAAHTRKFVAPPPPPPPPPPPEPAFSCPICMGPFVEEISTTCGHIFCKECLTKALKVKSICPTCRTKVTLKGTIRVFLPKTS